MINVKEKLWQNTKKNVEKKIIFRTINVIMIFFSSFIALFLFVYFYLMYFSLFPYCCNCFLILTSDYFNFILYLH